MVYCLLISNSSLSVNIYSALCYIDIYTPGDTLKAGTIAAMRLDPITLSTTCDKNIFHFCIYACLSYINILSGILIKKLWFYQLTVTT